MRALLLCAAIAMAAGLPQVQVALAADTDPVVGTWQLNASKSTFKSGPAIKSQTRTYSQAGDKITLEMKTVTADGKEVATHTTYQLNGKDFPVSGTADYDSLSAKQVDSHTAEFTLKKGGKAVGHTNRKVSKDGKTMTATSKITAAGGEPAENVLVFDKQ